MTYVMGILASLVVLVNGFFGPSLETGEVIAFIMAWAILVALWDIKNEIRKLARLTAAVEMAAAKAIEL